jgi:hypothetical protein
MPKTFDFFFFFFLFRFGAIWAIIKHGMSRSFQSKWTYVTRATLDSVLTKAHRPADLGGELEIDLAKWCEDRRVAESNVTVDPVFRTMGDPMRIPSRSSRSDTIFSRPNRRPSLVSTSLSPSGSAASSPNVSPRRRGEKPVRHSDTMVTESDESDSVDMALAELQRFGIDHVDYTGLDAKSSNSSSQANSGRASKANGTVFSASLGEDIDLGTAERKIFFFVCLLKNNGSTCCNV